MNIVLAGSLALGLLTACSETEFKGSSPSKQAAKTDDSVPADDPLDADPIITTPVAKTPVVISGGDKEEIEPGLFVGCKAGSSSLPIVADVYKLPEGSNRLPDFSAVGA